MAPPEFNGVFCAMKGWSGTRNTVDAPGRTLLLLTRTKVLNNELEGVFR
jgi:hypothetical protein